MPDTAANIGGANLDLDAKIRSLISEIIHTSPMKRPEIAERMSALLDRKISVHMIDCFTATCKEQHRFPAAWIEAFCSVTRDDRLQRLVMGPRYRKLVDYAERELKSLIHSRELAALREELIGDSK